MFSTLVAESIVLSPTCTFIERSWSLAPLSTGARGASHEKIQAAPSKKQSCFLEGPLSFKTKERGTLLEPLLCFLEGVVWNFSWLVPLCSHLWAYYAATLVEVLLPLQAVAYEEDSKPHILSSCTVIPFPCPTYQPWQL